MSTAPFPQPARPLPIAPARRTPTVLPLDAGHVNLTIRRMSKTHHGRTLQMLGHAAEYLVYSRGFLDTPPNAADDEAVRILMRLSSAVFREYADTSRVRRPVEDFVVGCANWLFE